MSRSASWTLSCEDGTGCSAVTGDVATYPALEQSAVLADISNQGRSARYRTPPVSAERSTAGGSTPYWTPVLRTRSTESLVSVGSSPCPAVVDNPVPAPSQQLLEHPSAASVAPTASSAMVSPVLGSGTLHATEQASSASCSATASVLRARAAPILHLPVIANGGVSQSWCTRTLSNLLSSASGQQPEAAFPVQSLSRGTPLSFAATPLAGIILPASRQSPVVKRVPPSAPLFGRSLWSLVACRPLTPTANQEASSPSECSALRSSQNLSPCTSRLWRPDPQDMAALIRCLWQ
jgi:hypothetical protein